MLTSLKDDYEIEQIMQQLDNGYCEVVVYTTNGEISNKMVFPTPKDALDSVLDTELELTETNIDTRTLKVKIDIGFTFYVTFNDLKLNESFSLVQTYKEEHA